MVRNQEKLIAAANKEAPEGVEDISFEEFLQQLDTFYRDELSKAALKRRDTSMLFEREAMLRPTARSGGEVIRVASLAVLAMTTRDLAEVIAAAAARKATIEAVAEGLAIPPDPPAVIMAQALEAWEKARHRAQTEGGRLAGAKIAAERNRQRTAAGLALIRDDWSLPTEEVSTAELVERSGLSYKTIWEHLGKRSKAQKTRLKREARARRHKEIGD
jgi:hypothetical protein